MTDSEADDVRNAWSQLQALEALRREEQLQMDADRAEIRAQLESGNAWGAATMATHLWLSDEVPQMMYEAWQDGRLDVEQLRAAVPEVWIHNKRPVFGLGQRRWLAMYKAIGFVWRSETTTGMESRFGTEVLVEQPKAETTVWRGAALSTDGRGMSWTLHRECAAEFAAGIASSYRVETGIYRADIPGRAVLAAFINAGEQEIVVNPYMLSGRIVLDESIAVPARDPEFVARLADVVSRTAVSTAVQEPDGSSLNGPSGL